MHKPGKRATLTEKLPSPNTTRSSGLHNTQCRDRLVSTQQLLMSYLFNPLRDVRLGKNREGGQGVRDGLCFNEEWRSRGVIILVPMESSFYKASPPLVNKACALSMQSA